MKFKRIAVYCGSSNHVDEIFVEKAKLMGTTLAQRKIELVYGGGHVGLMGHLADATLAAGGRVTGVIPRKLEELELGHQGAQDLFIVESMHERKAMMMYLSDAFIALPGGYGTLEELSEVLSLGTLNFHRKPVGILDCNDFYKPLLQFFDGAKDCGFIRPKQGDFLQISEDPNQLIDAMLTSPPAPIEEWLNDE